MKRGTRLVILGKQGAGKGTQGERLSRHFSIQHLSTGQLFRDSAAAGIPPLAVASDSRKLPVVRSLTAVTPERANFET